MTAPAHDLPEWQTLATAVKPQTEGLDTALDELRERFRFLSLEQARAVLAWHDVEVDRAAKAETAGLLHRVIAGLIQPGVNLKLAGWGLAFATGLDMLSGVPSQSACADKLGVDRQALNYWVKKWKGLLQFSVHKFCRGERASTACRDRAIRVHVRLGHQVRMDAVAD